jgi:hypothetical protein
MSACALGHGSRAQAFHENDTLKGIAMMPLSLPRVALACTLPALLMLSTAAPAGEIKVAYRFEAPRIEAASSGFVQATFEKTVQAGRPGEPSYPLRGCQILLPPGESVTGITVERKGWTLIAGSYRLYPTQEPTPGDNASAGPVSRFLYKAAAYQVDAWVAVPQSNFTTHYLRGHAIAAGCVSPLAFRPASGEVGYWTELDVTLQTAPSAESGAALELLRTDDDTNGRLERLVDNASFVSRYEERVAPLRDASGDFEYLIVTREALRTSFIPLKKFYDRRGLRTDIMTVEEIESGYPGRDTAEKIRAAIKDRYLNGRITHVLLGGDADGPLYDTKVVPTRGLFCEVHSSELYTDANIPADLYFSNLDGDWNADADADWGEPGEDDPYAEIAVGRACVDNAAEVATFINKTIMYQDHPVASQVRRAVMLGEKLWDNPLTYGEDELEQLIGTCTAHGFTTTGLPSGYTFVKKYDRTATWQAADAIAAINSGTNWVAHSGHSNWVYVMRMGIASVNDAAFTNDGVTANFPIIESNGCYAGSFDNRAYDLSYAPGDCIAEQLLTISHGAVAYIGNSRYGWFTEGTTNGPSHHLERELFDAVFAEGYHTLGAALARSKDETVPFLDLPDEYEPGAHRWCFYTFNLLGDPALDAWTDTPESLTVTHPPRVPRDVASLPLETADPRAVACLYAGGLVYARGVADPSGHIDLVRYRAIPDTVTSLELDVRAHNHYVRRVTLPVVESASVERTPSAVTLEQNVPNPFNPLTVIRYSLNRDGAVDLRVYDAAGREVTRLASGRQSRGSHEVAWRPSNLASGVYFYVLKSGGERVTRKALLLR